MTNQTNYDSCERIKLSEKPVKSELKIIDLSSEPFKYELWMARRKKMYEDRMKQMTIGVY